MFRLDLVVHKSISFPNKPVLDCTSALHCAFRLFFFLSPNSPLLEATDAVAPTYKSCQSRNKSRMHANEENKLESLCIAY